MYIHFVAVLVHLTFFCWDKRGHSPEMKRAAVRKFVVNGSLVRLADIAATKVEWRVWCRRSMQLHDQV
jgi:hypothetical protein